MPEIVECVINISEGRNVEKIQRIATGVDSIESAWLLGIHSDPDHHRSVLTIVGSPQPVFRAAEKVFEAAVDEINLKEHEGIHPRIGAVDVVPFVPIRSSMSRCVQLAREFGKRVADRFSVPIFFYENAAITPERRDLTRIRRGSLQGLGDRMAGDERWKPDFGPAQLHPTAGATVVGAREFLLAFNVLLDSRDLELARRIAREIRESSGGLPHVRALGLYLKERGVVQISMNLTNFRHTSIFAVFEKIKLEAEQEEVSVLESEVVGFLPRESLQSGDVEFLKIRDFGSGLILEDRIEAVTGWQV